MSGNLYAAPNADLERPVSHVALGDIRPGDFSIKQCLADAWKTCWATFPQWLGVGIVGMICIMASAVTIIGYFVVVPVLTWGIIAYLLNCLDGKSQFGDLFSGFKQYGKVLGRMLLFILIMIMFSIPVQGLLQIGMATQNTTFIIAGGIIYVIGIIIMMSFYFTIFFIVDLNMSAIDAMKASWRLTRGKTLKLVLLLLSMGLVMFAGILALGIGVIPASFMMYLMLGSAYRQMLRS